MTNRSRNVENLLLAPGTRIAQELEIEQELNSGGFGVTYLARDHSLGRRVAIKEYLPRGAGGRRADGTVGPRSSSDADEYEWGLKHFLAEARTLAQLDHERIVRVYRVIEAWGTAFMVMEYIKGRNLGETLQAEGPWPEPQVRALLEALLPGLTYVHGAGLIHRDIKPSNVMLREDGSPVLIDFGAARYAVGQHSQSLKSVLTTGYAPFEQYENRGNQGPWTDVYALGAVAYRALSGLVPEDATMRVRTDPLVPVTQVAAGVSEAFGSAVMSALAVWPENRPQDVEAWRAQWDAEASSEHHPPPPPPPEEDPPGTGGPTIITPPQTGFWKGGAGRRVAYGVAALVVAAAVTASIATWAGRAGTGSTTDPVIDPVPNPDPDPDDELRRERALGLDSAGWRRIQEGLAALGFDPGAQNGVPDDGTRRAVRRYQGREGKAITGYLDAADVTRLQDAALPPPPDPAAEERALGLDSAGWRRIQEGLAALGFDPGVPDGVAGAGTRRAVRRYQGREGKAITGYLDAADVTRLQDVFPRLVMNAPADGTLLGDGLGGRWVFNGTEGQRVRVEAGSNAFDTELELVSPTGDVIAQNDDGGIGTDSQLAMLLPDSGRYEVWVTAYDDGDSGPYTVTVSDGGGVTELVMNTPVGGTLLGDGTGGRWVFNGMEGQRVRVEAGSDAFDTELELVSPTGDVIAQNDDGGIGTDSMLAMLLPDSGRYEVWVTAYDDGDSGPYTVTVSDTGPFRLALNAMELGELLPDGTGGRWVFDGTEGQEISVLVLALFDTQLELVSPTGVVIAEDDDSGGGTNPLVEMALPVSGRYEVRVTAYDDDENGSYLVTVDDLPRLAMNETVTGDLLDDGTGGRWAFYAAEDSEIRVEVSSDAFDTMVEIVSPIGVVIAEDDDSGAGSDSLLEMTLPVSGRYEVRVTAYGDGDGGPYTVGLW